MDKDYFESIGNNNIKLWSIYPVISLIIGFMIYLLYDFFNDGILGLAPHWDLDKKTGILFISFLFSYGLFGLVFVFNKVRHINITIDFLIESSGQKKIIKNNFRLFIFAIVLMVTLIPFCLIDLIVPHQSSTIDLLREIYLQTYILEENGMSLLFDIFNFCIGLSIHLMVSIIIWLIVCMELSLNDFRINADQLNLRKHLSDIQMSLKSIKGHIVQSMIYFLGLIFLHTISFDPSLAMGSKNVLDILDGKNYEIILLGFLLILVLIFFLAGLRNIDIIFRRQREISLASINRKAYRSLEELLEMRPICSHRRELDRMNYLTSFLDSLQQQRLILNDFSAPGLDLRTLVAFVITYAIPLLTFIDKIYPGCIADILNYPINLVSQLI